VPPAHRPHVLVVDDESNIREALATALRGQYVVHPAASGAEASACLRAHPIAAIILDAILEDEHGLDLVEGVHALSSAPILLLTGHGSEELAGRAVWAGVRGYLKKPVSIPVLSPALAARTAGRTPTYLLLSWLVNLMLASTVAGSLLWFGADIFARRATGEPVTKVVIDRSKAWHTVHARREKP